MEGLVNRRCDQREDLRVHSRQPKRFSATKPTEGKRARGQKGKK